MLSKSVWLQPFLKNRNINGLQTLYFVPFDWSSHALCFHLMGSQDQFEGKKCKNVFVSYVCVILRQRCPKFAESNLPVTLSIHFKGA